MGVSQYYDAMVKMENQPRGADDPVYKPPVGHDRELDDSQRAALPKSFEATHKAKHAAHPKHYRHGQDALGKIPSTNWHRVRVQLEFE